MPSAAAPGRTTRSGVFRGRLDPGPSRSARHRSPIVISGRLRKAVVLRNSGAEEPRRPAWVPVEECCNRSDGIFLVIPCTPARALQHFRDGMSTNIDAGRIRNTSTKVHEPAPTQDYCDACPARTVAPAGLFSSRGTLQAGAGRATSLHTTARARTKTIGPGHQIVPQPCREISDARSYPSVQRIGRHRTRHRDHRARGGGTDGSPWCHRAETGVRQPQGSTRANSTSELGPQTGRLGSGSA